MKTKSLSMFLVALFVVEMNLGTEEDNNENKKGEDFKYEKTVVEGKLVNFNLKTILIGDSNVGKSVLIEKIYKDIFSEDLSPTVGFDFRILDFNIVSDIKKPVLRYQIWDCCGHEIYRTLVTSFFCNASVFLLAYDVTDDKSFKDIDVWLEEVKKENPKGIEHFVLIGNKTDLEDKRVVSKEAGKKFAEEKGMKFVEVSAKTGDGIKELEYILAKIIYEEFNKEKEKVEDVSKGDCIVVGKHTYSSSLCDCCKKICENC